MSALRNVERVFLPRDEWDRLQFLFVAALIISINPFKIDCFHKPFKQLIKVQMIVFWNVTPCSLVGMCQNFGGPVVFFRAEEAGRVTVRGGRRNYTPSCRTRSSFLSHRHAYLQPQTVYQISAHRSETINK